MNRFTAFGIALGLTAGVTAFVYGAQHPASTLPPTPAITEVSAPVESAPIEPAEQSLQLPAPIDINDVKPGTRCNPYVNGVYVGELCGDHDAFAEKAERTARPL
jgi:hypothetical protein